MTVQPVVVDLLIDLHRRDLAGRLDAVPPYDDARLTTELGLFPDWYATPQPDWPSALRLAGFGRFGLLGCSLGDVLSSMTSCC